MIYFRNTPNFTIWSLNFTVLFSIFLGLGFWASSGKITTIILFWTWFFVENGEFEGVKNNYFGLFYDDKNTTLTLTRPFFDIFEIFERFFSSLLVCQKYRKYPKQKWRVGIMMMSCPSPFVRSLREVDCSVLHCCPLYISIAHVCCCISMWCVTIAYSHVVYLRAIWEQTLVWV